MISGLRGFVGALVRERPGRLVWVIAVQAAAAFGAGGRHSAEMSDQSGSTGETRALRQSTGPAQRLARGVRLLRRLALGVDAAASISVASLAVRMLDQRQIVRLLGVPVERTARPIAPPETRARVIGRAVGRVAHWLPWHPACLPQSIATRWMLRRRGIDCDAHLGIVSTTPFAAHAWVSVGDTVVQGGPVAHVSEIARLR